MDIETFISQHKIKLTHKPYPDYVPRRGSFSANASHYKVTLTLGKRALHTEFHRGAGHCGAPPTAAEVLDCLLSDATAQPFRDWASDMDTDIANAADRREARRTWRACTKVRKNLMFLLGDAFDTLINEVERL